MTIARGLARLDSRRDADIEITDMTDDSRTVHEGSLFCCVPGEHFDGHDFATQAVASGARALLCERELPVDVAQVIVRNVRATMGPLASALFGHPSRSLSVVGVTGTNGKTTTVHLIAAILSATGMVTEVLGTLRGPRTTPEAPELQQILGARATTARSAVAMEVSSHALAQHRVDGTRFAAAIFTNLSPDHLDYHRTMEEYFRAKARLFESSFTKVAVIDIDTTYGRLLADSVRLPVVVRSGASTVDVLSVGLADSAFRWRDQIVRLAVGRPLQHRQRGAGRRCHGCPRHRSRRDRGRPRDGGPGARPLRAHRGGAALHRARRLCAHSRRLGACARSARARDPARTDR